MDSRRVDALARLLASRRAVVVGLAGLGLPRFAAAPTAAKPKRRSCQGQPDRLKCGKGKRCSSGVCAKPPECGGLLFTCQVGSDCCGGVCVTNLGCTPSNVGLPCQQPIDCGASSSQCVGFVCCRAQGEACAVDAECCQGFCNTQAGSCDCLARGEPCVGGARSCCSGQCHHRVCR